MEEKPKEERTDYIKKRRKKSKIHFANLVRECFKNVNFAKIRWDGINLLGKVFFSF